MILGQQDLLNRSSLRIWIGGEKATKMNAPSSSSGPKHRADVVRTVFPNAISLYEYCTSIIQQNQQQVVLIQPTDSKAYCDLLHTSIIIPPPDDEINKYAYSFNGKDKFPVHELRFYEAVKYVFDPAEYGIYETSAASNIKRKKRFNIYYYMFK